MVFVCVIWCFVACCEVILLGGLVVVTAAYSFDELLVFAFSGLWFDYLIVLRLVCGLFVVCLLLRIGVNSVVFGFGLYCGFACWVVLL